MEQQYPHGIERGIASATEAIEELRFTDISTRPLFDHFGDMPRHSLERLTPDTGSSSENRSKVVEVEAANDPVDDCIVFPD